MGRDAVRATRRCALAASNKRIEKLVQEIM
jgi:hypothetical protein